MSEVSLNDNYEKDPYCLSVEETAADFIENLLESAVEEIRKQGVEVEFEKCIREPLSPVEWPSTSDFTPELGLQKVDEYITTWPRNAEMIYCIDYTGFRRDSRSDFHFYEVKWSVPNMVYPVPPAVASVFFTVELSRIRPPTCPVKTAGDGAGEQRSVMERLLDRLERCLRSQALSLLDGLQAADEATVWPGVQLVRADGAEARPTGGQAGGRTRDSTLHTDEDDRWAATAVDKLANLMRTHVIRLHLSPPADDDREEGRRIRYRHQYKHMFPLVVMGYMVMSAFLVPMGFQLMAVLSGKALLLSKMALAVAGMAGFKRLFLASLGNEYPPPPPPVVHHDTYPVYHEHHASFVK